MRILIIEDDQDIASNLYGLILEPRRTDYRLNPTGASLDPHQR
jgi:hypothetical protein